MTGSPRRLIFAGPIAFLALGAAQGLCGPLIPEVRMLAGHDDTASGPAGRSPALLEFGCHLAPAAGLASPTGEHGPNGVEDEAHRVQ